MGAGSRFVVRGPSSVIGGPFAAIHAPQSVGSHPKRTTTFSPLFARVPSQSRLSDLEQFAAIRDPRSAAPPSPSKYKGHVFRKYSPEK